MSTRDKGQNIMIKGPIDQEDTVVVRDFNTHVIPDRKINKETRLEPYTRKNRPSRHV